MKTVLVFTTSYSPFIGGAEVAIEEITKRLSDDFQFFIITARQDSKLPAREIRPKGTILRIGIGSAMLDKWLLAFFGGLLVAWKLLFGEWKGSYKKHEVVFLGVDISQGSLAAAFASFFLPRVPFVLNLQYGYGDERLARGRGGAIKYAFRWMLSRADFVTAISTYLLRLARENPYSYRDSAEIVPNGVDIERFMTQDSRIMNHEWGEKPVIITISRLVSKNGVDILIEAIAEVKKEIPDIQCHIIGDGPELESYKLKTKSYKLENNIHFFGAVPYSDISEYLHNADVFVRPSRSEGMGNAFIEALAAGLPIIGTPVGGILDIIEDGKTGLLSNADQADDLAEKIMTLFNNRALAQSIVINGRSMIHNRFLWSAIAEKYKNIFNTVLVSNRIVIAAPLFPPDIGGPATYVRTLSEDLWKQKILPKIVYFGDVRRFPKVARHCIYFLRVYLKALGRSAIFAQDPVSTGFPAMLAAKLLRKKFLLKVVGDYAWEQWQQHESRIMNRESWRDKNMSLRAKRSNLARVKSGEFVDPEKFQKLASDWKTELRRSVERLVAKSADIIMVPSSYLKKIVVLWGVVPDKITVIPNAFDVPTVAETKESVREKLNFSGTAIISVGRLVPWKGFEKLIELMSRVIAKIPDAVLYIIGDGPERKKLEQITAHRKLENHVRFIGAVPHVMVLSHLQGGDLFILNTGYEGLSHVLLEAMAMEIPVVTTNVCGNPEVIENGVEGLLVDYNDQDGLLNAISMLLKNDDLREKMVMRAKEKVSQFSHERMISATKDILLQ
ncbi:MAG: glycosyltransferase family 4 protein [Candidatus Sungbacteria bacterium]|nr:glycosyltransferase family 4 protein [Candidatus Sungbacteria bacterium]